MVCASDKKNAFDENSFFMIKKELITTRLKELAKKGKTREVAEKWGVSPSTLDRYINKGSMPSLDRAISIAIAEGVSLQWLATGSEAQQEQENKDYVENEDWNRVLNIMNQSDSDKLLGAVVARGVNNLVLPEKTLNIALLIKDLPDEAIREISLLINEAQYCALRGVPFRIATKEIKNASGRRG